VRAPDGSEHISGEVFEYDPPNKLTGDVERQLARPVAKLGTTLVTYEIEQAARPSALTMSERHDRALGDRHLSRRAPLARDPVRT
jgi:hypothetical protein